MLTKTETSKFKDIKYSFKNNFILFLKEYFNGLEPEAQFSISTNQE